MDVFSVVVTARTIVEPPSRHALEELVVPLDGSDHALRALPTATAVASRLGARLRLITTRADLGDRSPAAYLDDLVDSLGLDASTEVLLDQPPADAVAAAAGRTHVGVCMATHARGRLLAGLHPNVADEVISQVAGPIILVGPHCPIGAPREGPFLVAHDGSSEATESSAALVEFAAAMRRPIRVITVVSAPGVRATAEPYAEERLEHARLAERARRHGIDVESDLVFATHVRAGIVDEIGRSGASFVAMMSHRRDRLERLREGSTTMGVVHDADVPVVVVGADRR